MLCDVGSDVVVHEINAVSELEKLEPEWFDLWRRCPLATPFQSPPWILSWWRCFGEGKLCALAVRREGALKGLVPLQLQSNAATGETHVSLIGAGISDYLDGLFDPECDHQSADAIFEFLNQHLGWPTRVELGQLRSSSPLLKAPAAGDWNDSHGVQDFCPVLSLPNDCSGLAEKISSSLRQKLPYYERRLARVGSWRIETATADNLDELLEAFIRLHGERWRTRGCAGALANPAVQRFHRAVAPKFLKAGLLRMCALRIERRIVAVLYGFHHSCRSYYYLSGFDPEFQKFNVGTVVLKYAIEQAVRERTKEFDFLRGQEDYKYLWGAKDQAIYRRLLNPIEETRTTRVAPSQRRQSYDYNR
jgi:CelD/BcsL family acetyltransferase involved in cellulose biosynthesis